MVFGTHREKREVGFLGHTEKSLNWGFLEVVFFGHTEKSFKWGFLDTEKSLKWGFLYTERKFESGFFLGTHTEFRNTGSGKEGQAYELCTLLNS